MTLNARWSKLERMELTRDQFEKIAGCFPVQRGNVKTENYTLVNALLYMAENGCKWRALPGRFGKWDTIYRRFNRWAKSGVMERVFLALQAEKLVAIKVEVMAMDSTSCKAHPDAHGALKKTGSRPSGSPRADGTPSFMWSPQMTRSSLRYISLAGSAGTGRRGGSPWRK